jgi:hypothetical protein
VKPSATNANSFPFSPLLGINAPAYYLVRILDSTELRPGGGFIKDYGFATSLEDGEAAHISDTNLLDNNFLLLVRAIIMPSVV